MGVFSQFPVIKYFPFKNAEKTGKGGEDKPRLSEIVGEALLSGRLDQMPSSHRVFKVPKARWGCGAQVRSRGLGESL